MTGGAKKFNLSHGLKNAFKEGLIKAACSTDAWIITGGTNTGVMRLVGEAASELLPKYGQKTIPIIGVATWGVISMRPYEVKFIWVNTLTNLTELNTYL